jgi:hypothetical protein
VARVAGMRYGVGGRRSLRESSRVTRRARCQIQLGLDQVGQFLRESLHVAMADLVGIFVEGTPMSKEHGDRVRSLLRKAGYLHTTDANEQRCRSPRLAGLVSH